MTDRISFFLIGISLWSIGQLAAQEVLRLDTDFTAIPLYPHLSILEDPDGSLSFAEVSKEEMAGSFVPLAETATNNQATVHWLRFAVQNNQVGQLDYYLNIAFADSIELFIPQIASGYKRKTSGDMYPLSERDVALGQIVSFQLKLFPGRDMLIYAKVQSNSHISQDARKLTLNSFTLLSQEGFDERYIAPRIYQALFYGAFFIMLFYNFFLFITLKSRSYVYYIFYMLAIALFLSSNSGYLLELVIPNYPRLDLYTRFFTVTLVLVSYILFSRSYLNLSNYLPLLDKVFKGAVVLLCLVAVLMVSGYWILGRSINIGLTVVIFMAILVAGIVVYRRGFSPARYFLLANSLLLIGGILFALEKTTLQLHNPLTQYSIQISIVLEVALFSLGLADRINLTRKQLSAALLDKERTEKKQAEDKKRLIEQKNVELEEKVKERTEEVVSQKEVLEEQNKNITASIRYAQRIQQAMLGDITDIQKQISYSDEVSSFIFFRPRDVVSGDFYWYEKVQSPVNGEIQVVIAADCTGHGVPGAFMTVMGSNLLTEIIRRDGTIEPSLILQELDKKLTSQLQRGDSSYQSNDGMDMSVLVLNLGARSARFAGAKNPLYFVRNGEIDRKRGDKYPIGGKVVEEGKVFQTHEISVQHGDMYYIFSDGFQDQFGGEDGRKFMSKKFREYLNEISHLSCPEQEKALGQTLDQWMEGYKQTDDILVIGLKVM